LAQVIVSEGKCKGAVKAILINAFKVAVQAEITRLAQLFKPVSGTFELLGTTELPDYGLYGCSVSFLHGCHLALSFFLCLFEDRSLILAGGRYSGSFLMAIPIFRNP
jgi:hypothetical protein